MRPIKGYIPVYEVYVAHMKINSQSLDDTQVGYISQKYTLDDYISEKYTLVMVYCTCGEFALVGSHDDMYRIALCRGGPPLVGCVASYCIVSYCIGLYWMVLHCIVVGSTGGQPR